MSQSRSAEIALIGGVGDELSPQMRTDIVDDGCLQPRVREQLGDRARGGGRCRRRTDQRRAAHGAADFAGRRRERGFGRDAEHDGHCAAERGLDRILVADPVLQRDDRRRGIEFTRERTQRAQRVDGFDEEKEHVRIVEFARRPRDGDAAASPSLTTRPCFVIASAVAAFASRTVTSHVCAS